MKNNKLVLGCLVFVFLLSACGNSGNAPTDNQADDLLPGEVRGEVYINESRLIILESYPIQATVNILGDLPTPCHKFKAKVSPPNKENEIHIEVYSVVKADEICVQALEPISEFVPIPMSGNPDGIYTVWVNGENIGEVRYPGG